MNVFNSVTSSRVLKPACKNLQAEIGHFNTQIYKNLFSLAKKSRFLYKKTLLFYSQNTGFLIVRNCEISEKYTMKIICLIQYVDEETSKLKIFFNTEYRICTV